MNQTRTLEQIEAEGKFQRAGHMPENPECDHKHWDFRTHVRYCPCGTVMVDFGD